MYAAIDIGTNSIHLVVARAHFGGGFDVVTTAKDMVRLGESPGPRKELAPEAIDRGVTALKRMVEIAVSYRAQISAVATSATREAPNKNVFIERVLAETGLEIEVISGIEEARLIHLGVLQSLPVYDKSMLVVDIGGGSTEFLAGQGPEILDARSLKLGAVRLTEQYFPDGKAGNKALNRCAAHVANSLAPVSRMLSNLSFEPDLAIGSSGTISAVAAIAAADKGEEIKGLHGHRFTAEDVDRVVGLLKGTHAEERADIGGLDARRVDIIIGGAVLLQGIFRSFEIPEMTVSDFALREGLLFDRMTGDDDRVNRRLADLRRTTADGLASQLDPDVEHARTAARLALSIFDQTRSLHGLDGAARELLELAAIVHNVGLFISHAAHHRHTYYVVRHSERLRGFNENERELLALIARYHRRSHPKQRHPEYAALGKSDQNLVRVASGILRIAIGLDRSHKGLVRDVRVESGKGQLTIEPIVEADTDLALERYAAQTRSDLLADALDVAVQIGGPGDEVDLSV